MLEGSVSRGLKSVRNYFHQINAIAITTTDIPLFAFLPNSFPISFHRKGKEKEEEKFITRKN